MGSKRTVGRVSSIIPVSLLKRLTIRPEMNFNKEVMIIDDMNKKCVVEPKGFLSKN